MDLFQTSKDNRHSHLVVVDQESSSGTTTVSGSSKKSQHRHTVTLEPISNTFVLLQAEDGHTHLITPLKRTPPAEDTRKPTEIVRDQRLLYRAAKALDDPFFTKGQESFDYVAGEMYTAKEKQELKDDSQPPSVMNEIEPKMDLLSGYQRQNRFDPKFFPVEGGDVTVADILTTLFKQDAEANLFEHRESAVFEDGATAGRGLMQMRVDRSKEIGGRIVFERYKWNGAAFGPHEEPDASDLEYLVKWKRYSFAKFKQVWPEKADELDATVRRLAGGKQDVQGSAATDIPSTEPHTQTKPDQYEASVEPALIAELDADWVNHIDILKKDILVLELQQKKFSRVPVLFNAAADFYFNAEGVATDDLKAVERDIPGFELVWRMVDRFWITITAHDLLVEDGQAPPEMTDFSLIPFYAKKFGDRVWGKVESMKYPNRQINKLNRKFIDLIDKVGGAGWFSDTNTFANQGQKDDFDKVRSKAGFHAQVANIANVPQKTEGMKFPVEIVEGINMSSEKLKEISNIVAELLGLNSKAESGIAINAKKQQGLIGNEFLFDNFRLTKRLIAKRYLQMVPHVYDAKRIVRIIANIHQRTPLKLAGLQRFDPMPLPVVDPAMAVDEVAGPPGQPAPAGQPVADPNQPSPQQPPQMQQGPVPLMPHHLEAIERILTDHDFSLYDVAIGESTANPTTRATNFEFALMLIEKFPQIGAVTLDLVINMSDFSEKDEWIQRIKLAMGLGTPPSAPGGPQPAPKAAPPGGTPTKRAA